MATGAVRRGEEEPALNESREIRDTSSERKFWIHRWLQCIVPTQLFILS